MLPREVGRSQSAIETCARPANSRAYDLNTPLPQLIEDAVGADISLFAPERVQIGSGCRACMSAGNEEGDKSFTCPVIKSLAAGGPVQPDCYPSICEAGRSIRVHSLENGNGGVLVVEPRGCGRGEEIEQRLHAIAALWERCERLAGETEGLAQEVIRSYEQINVIFDVTQQLGKSRDAAQIKHFLIGRLAQTLRCEWSCCLLHGGSMLWWSSGDRVRRDEAIAELRARHADTIRQVTDRSTSLVLNRSQDPTGQSRYSLLFGALGDQATPPDVIVLARPSDQPEFVYGDLMMIDSTMSHAQNVLTNLKLVERLRTMSLGAVRALVSAIDKKDHYTSGHSERVGFLSQLIGRRMGLTPEQLQDLEWGGLLHDVGKIGIQDGILTKPGGLTADEFDLIKKHPLMSYEIIAPIDCMESVRDVVLFHHELPDGTGYPKGLKGEEIPLLARIVHVADTFDALTTSRSYRSAFPVSKALDIMNREKGSKLDPEIVGRFVDAFEAFRVEQPDEFRQLFAHLVLAAGDEAGVGASHGSATAKEGGR